LHSIPSDMTTDQIFATVQCGNKINIYNAQVNWTVLWTDYEHYMHTMLYDDTWHEFSADIYSADTHINLQVWNVQIC